jgi:hypothetical protein
MPSSDRAPKHKKEQLSATISRLHTCLKSMIKETNGACAFKNKSRLADEIGRRLDLDPSVFRKSGSEHRKVLNLYLHLLIPATPVTIEDVSVELKRLSSLAIEQKRKIKILENLLREHPPTHTTPVHTSSSDNYYYEYETTCLMLADIFVKNPNLHFKNGALYDNATFSGDPELVSTKKNAEAYLRWKNGRPVINECLEKHEGDQ